MKNTIFGIATIFFGMLAIIHSQPLTAQSKTASSVQQQSYKFDDDQESLNKEYIDRILNKKMKMLQHDLSVLIEKKQPGYIKAVDSAMILFNHDESKLISITSKSGKVSVKPVRTYLNDVARLPYKNINITYRNYTAINNIREQPDGTYKGIAVFEQEFTGFDKEGKAMYNDVVKRNVEIIVKIVEHKLPEKHLVTVNVFFGNMGVSEM